mmetsp:Transcript_5291/g.14852  ORF Transcript_5291/g.14852 Transcript_5291/m.14852 type:complete len:756 (-) Transcript_5291:698-2965(-)
MQQGAETGSLLTEALNHETSLENTLIVDVFLVGAASSSSSSSSSSNSPIDQLLALATIAVELNEFVQANGIVRNGSGSSSSSRMRYPWMQGGDGPVFGVHVSSSSRIPHLRCQCRYGPAVADEWRLIGLVLEYSRSRSNIAIECLDVDDGQIILIQAAERLPDWVDQIGPERCRHRCWIYQGLVHLLEPTHDDHNDNTDNKCLTVSDAVNALGDEPRQRPASTTVQANHEITNCIQETVTQVVHRSQHFHRAAVALPRPLAQALERRPDWIPVLCHQFVVQHIRTAAVVVPTKTNAKHSPKFSSYAHEEEWIWTALTFGRTHYAMLRSVVAPPDWTTETSIPHRYTCPQVKRLQRQAQNQATPHLRLGIPLGVRLVAAVDAILGGDKASLPTKKTTTTTTLSASHDVEKRVTQLWSRIEQQLYSTNLDATPQQQQSSSSEILQAWIDGPNHARYDLSNVMKCPVFDVEVANAVAPLSQPNVPLVDQIQQELKREGPLYGPNQQDVVPTPSPQDVDKEDWMVLPSDFAEMEHVLKPSAKANHNNKDSHNNGAIKGGGEVNTVLDGFHSFLKGKSTHEGVSNENEGNRKEAEETNASTPKDGETASMSIQLNPKVFLNLLQFTLKAESGDEITNLLTSMGTTSNDGDEFFSAEDYQVGDDDEDDDDDDDQSDQGVTSMMDAMDKELSTKTTGRTRDGIEAATAETGDENLADDLHLLTNLFKSMEASGANAGPVTSVMAAMGRGIPKFEVAEAADEV